MDDVLTDQRLCRLLPIAVVANVPTVRQHRGGTHDKDYGQSQVSVSWAELL